MDIIDIIHLLFKSLWFDFYKKVIKECPILSILDKKSDKKRNKSCKNKDHKNRGRFFFEKSQF
jgi:hypothetical protein